jgi:hypothetical protein
MFLMGQPDGSVFPFNSPFARNEQITFAAQTKPSVL